MTFAEVLEQLRSLLPDDAPPLTSDTALADLGLDSLDLVELWVMTEESGLDLPPQLFEELRTIGDLEHYWTVKLS